MSIIRHKHFLNRRPYSIFFLSIKQFGFFAKSENRFQRIVIHHFVISHDINFERSVRPPVVEYRDGGVERKG